MLETVLSHLKAIFARRINIRGCKDYKNTFARNSVYHHQQQPLSPSQETDDTIRVVLPFKDQISADIVKKQLKDLSLKVHTTIQPVFVSRKIEQELSVKETKPPIVNQQCVVYGFQCDLCDAGYVGYTRGHLHNRVKGHKQHSSAIAKHYKNTHGTMPVRAC